MQISCGKHTETTFDLQYTQEKDILPSLLLK